MDGRLFSWIKMGDLNNAAQLTLLTSVFYTTDRQVWRISNIPEPGLPVCFLAGVCMIWLSRRVRPWV